MPRLTARLRGYRDAPVDAGALVPGQSGDVAFDALDELRDLADLLLGGAAAVRAHS